MIPSSITPAHVRQAAGEIRNHGVPKGREADKFLALVGGLPFPPKYLLSIAGRFATGIELDAADFSGGNEANQFLQKLGFQIVPKNQDWSREECLLAVWAYDRMDQDRSLVKKRLYEEVAGLIGRTAKSVEFKLQNISSCDPRPRNEKPINEAANKQHLLQEIFEEYWRDRPAGRIRAGEVGARRVPKQSAWDQALQRIRASKFKQTYMPIAVIAALELIQEGLVTPDAVPFTQFESWFDALQSTLGEGAIGMGWEPFLHLAATANIWTLKQGPGKVEYQRSERPKSRTQLLKIIDSASFNEDLQAGTSDPELITRLKGMIGTVSQKPTSDPDVLQAAVEALKGKLGPDPPPGNPNPKKSQGSKSSFVRDPKVVRWVLDRAKGACELCTKPAPFLDSWGEPFLEVHHVVQLADGGPDTVENARGLCPNCHREVHLGASRAILISKLNDSII